MGFRNNKTRAIGKSKNTARYGCGLAIEGQLIVYLIGPRKGGRYRFCAPVAEAKYRLVQITGLV